MTICVLSRNQCGKASGIYYTVIPVIDLLKIYSKLVWCRYFLPLTICTLNASLSILVRCIHIAFWRSGALIHIPIDIKSDNLQEIEDKSVLESFTQTELKSPSPRKIINGLPVYASRRFDLPKVFGRAVLSDFGSAVQGDERRNHDAQPNVYRSPEVMLKTDWSYPVDIWNVGVMVYLSSPLSISIPCTDQLGKTGVGFAWGQTPFLRKWPWWKRLLDQGASCRSHGNSRSPASGYASAWKTKQWTLFYWW